MAEAQLFDLTDKVALVTGGNGGIGAGIAVGLAQAGADVVIAARNAQKSSTVVETIEALGRRALAVRCDVLDRSDLEATVGAVQDHFGRLDVLVNNAGVVRRGQAHELSEEDWDLVLGTNLKSVFLLTKLAYPMLKADGGGKVINIGSMTSIFGSGRVPSYSTSKGGLVQLTKSMAIPLGHRQYSGQCNFAGLDSDRDDLAVAHERGPQPSDHRAYAARAVGRARGPRGHGGVLGLGGVGFCDRPGTGRGRRLLHFLTGVDAGRGISWLGLGRRALRWPATKWHARIDREAAIDDEGFAGDE